jgi:hypothetical protein
MTEEDVRYICDAIREIAVNAHQLLSQYRYSVETNEYYPLQQSVGLKASLERWFTLAPED